MNGTQTAEVLNRGTEALVPVDVRAGFTEEKGFALIQRGAALLAASTLVPKDYQDNVPNCVIALEMAQRIGASPLMVMQNLYVVHGRPAWSSQFLIACVNQSGRFTALQYEWIGSQGQDEWGCRAWAIDKSTKQRVQGPAVSMAIAKKEGWVDRNGSKWKTLPELMLTYRAATFFARTNAPELTMGLQTAEEVADVIDLQPGADGTYQRVQPARRVSEASPVNGTATSAAAEPPATDQSSAPAPEIEKSETSATPANPTSPAPTYIGRVVKVEELPNGTMVTLHTGFRCATTSPELIKAVRNLAGTDTEVELVCKAPSQPRFLPALKEILPSQREAGAEG